MIANALKEMSNERRHARAYLRSSAPTPDHGPARASKKAMRQVRQWRFFYAWAESQRASRQTKFKAKNRAKLGGRDERRIFGDDETEVR
jgi:hypothetical protein